MFDWLEWWNDELDGQMFDYAIGNPPFGRVRRSADAPRYKGADFEFHVIDIASQMADYGTFIVPQQSASFQYSGRPYYERRETGRATDFEKLTGLVMEAGAGVDTSILPTTGKIRASSPKSFASNLPMPAKSSVSSASASQVAQSRRC